MNKNSSQIGEIIRQRRAMMHITQKELAKTAGVSPSCLARLEIGDRFPSARILRKLANPLGFDEIELFTAADYLPPQSSDMLASGTHIGKLDPTVAWALSQEPIEAQRAMLAIFSALKHIANGITRGKSRK
jgi:transcriptional regulator with XRE-family HTH domain